MYYINITYMLLQSTPKKFRQLQHFLHYITVVCYSLENMTRTQELNCQNKFILITSDNFDRKVCNGLQSTKMIQLLNLSTQLIPI